MVWTNLRRFLSAANRVDLIDEIPFSCRTLVGNLKKKKSKIRRNFRKSRAEFATTMNGTGVSRFLTPANNTTKLDTRFPFDTTSATLNAIVP